MSVSNWLRMIATGASTYALCSGIASAQTYSWTLTGPDTGSGTFFTTATVGGGFDVDGFTGIIDGLAVTEIGGNPGQPTNSPDGFFTYDNLVFPGSDPLLDVDGLLLAYNGSEANLWGNAPGDYEFYAEIGAQNDGDIFAINFIPEPASIAVFGAGMLAVGFASWRRRAA